MGIVMACMGIINVVNPGSMKKMIAFWRQGNRVYLGGLLRLLIGTIFLLSYSQAKIPGVICVLGSLILLGGILIFILGLGRVKIMLEWGDKRPRSILRLIALLVLGIGALVIYSA